MTIAIASFLLGVSVFYLLFIGFRTPEKEKIEHEAQKETDWEPALQVQDAHIPDVDIQVPETSKAAPEDDRAELLTHHLTASRKRRKAFSFPKA